MSLMMTCNAPSSLVQIFSSKLLSKSLESVCSTSLKLIENASSTQVSAAVEYNQKTINILLLQLLAINFISQNRNHNENDVNHVNDLNHNQNHNHNNDIDIETYCERKLLSLSPILGFSRKNYFVQCTIGDDTRMEILSYLKPIEIFQKMALINKQFNENVQMMHQSYKHANVFCNKQYVFESFSEVKKYCDKNSNKNTNRNKRLDWQRALGQWMYGTVDNIDKKKKWIHVRAKMGHKNVRSTNSYGQVAPVGIMTYRPGNKHRFVKVLKHGHCNETCDVNLKTFNIRTKDGAGRSRYANIIYGFLDENSTKIANDIWRCGWINFDWTWNEVIYRNGQGFGVTYDDVDHDEKILENSDNDENKKFRIFQVRIHVDITEEYNKHDDSIKMQIKKLFSLRKAPEDRWIISIVCHCDDIDTFTYFGSKTTLEQQLKIEKYLFDAKFARLSNNNDGSKGMCRSKIKLLNGVNYPNYCIVTPCGVFNAMSDNVEERKQFSKWYRILQGKAHVYEVECTSSLVSSNAVNKVYYDKENDQLCIKLLPWFRLVLHDSNAPAPLKQSYIIANGNQCRLVTGKIVDCGIIDKVKMEGIEDVDKKKERYFDLLRKWKGFIQVCVDITVEFNQFQERIKNEYIQFHGNQKEMNWKKNELQLQIINDEIEWDRRQYFLNNNEMPYLKYNQKEDIITHDVYVLLDSKRVCNFDAKFDFFDTLTELHKKKLLENIFGFLHVDPPGAFGAAFVCKTWYRIAKNWVGLLQHR